jgi:hypothetical protein
MIGRLKLRFSHAIINNPNLSYPIDHQLIAARDQLIDYYSMV